MRKKYKGKYPTRIREVSAKGGIAYVTTNDGTRYITRASERNRKLPEVGRDISEYPTREPARLGEFANPRGRSQGFTQGLRDAYERGGTQAYKNYLITHNALHGVYFITRGGHNIASAQTITQAKKMIDEIADNPRGRSKRGVTRPSQITGKAPTKRLLKRRKATAKAPAGFFANPVDVNDLRSEGTYSRVTKPMLQNKLAALSKALRAPAWPARGAIGLDMAFNGYRLVQITDGTAEQDLSPRLKAGEMANFLDGALMVAKAVK